MLLPEVALGISPTTLKPLNRVVLDAFTYPAGLQKIISYLPGNMPGGNVNCMVLLFKIEKLTGVPENGGLNAETFFTLL